MSKVEDLKLRNTQLVRMCFYDGNIWTKNEISDVTYLSKAAVTNILKELCDSKEIIYQGEASSTGGRKSKQYRLNKDYFHIGKVILERNKEYYVYSYQIVDALNDMIFEKTLQYPKGNLTTLLNIIKDMQGYDENIQVLCLSIPGICENGYLSICDFHELKDINIIDEITKVTHLEVIVENDVNVASIGFYHKKPIETIAMIYQPALEFVGVGMMVHHKLFNGFSHFAGELRYLPFYDEKTQSELLQKEPLELLRKQIETICCVINPQCVAICSDVLSKEEINTLELKIPKQHQPEIVYINSLKEYLYDGLYYIANHIKKGEINENINA